MCLPDSSCGVDDPSQKSDQETQENISTSQEDIIKYIQSLLFANNDQVKQSTAKEREPLKSDSQY